MRSDRLALLSEFGADCREIETVENTPAQTDSLGDLLVVFGVPAFVIFYQYAAHFWAARVVLVANF